MRWTASAEGSGTSVDAADGSADLMFGSAADAFAGNEIVKENPHVIGGMTWTGYDYPGEAV